jgi:superfamily II DNA or RNA helicase
MSTKFFTNDSDNTLIKKFEGFFEHNQGIQNFDALVGYLRSSGYFKVREFLNKVPKIRLLVGISADKIIAQANNRGLEFFADREKAKEEFINEVLIDIENANYDEKTEKGIKQFFQDLIEQKIEVRTHPEKTIHAKVYIFYKDIHNHYNTERTVITGSSNLTDSGIGSKVENNYEFNVELSEYADVKFAYDEFEKLWNESENILPVDAEEIVKKSYLKDDFTPYEMYIKMMIEYFGNRVEYDPYNIELLLPEKYMRLKYQTDAANQGYEIMRKHNGFILADVVGLGKTIIALMVIKKFIYENGSHSKVLIVAPPAIKPNWQRTAQDFLIDNHLEYVTTGSLHKVLSHDYSDLPNAERYDLIVVDESHKFRNDYTDAYLALQEICKKPRIKAGENGDTRKKVILISATPLNNRPEDIENQLYLFQDRRNSTLEIPNKNLQEYFKPINAKYKELAGEDVLNIKALKLLFGKLRNDIVEPLVIRRTRKDIDNVDEYKEDLAKQKIKFPNVGDPTPLFYELDKNLAKLFINTIDLISGIDENGKSLPNAFGYYRYRAIEALINEADRKLYAKRNQTAENISDRLAGIMRTLMVKRLESSFFAFKQSLRRLQKATENMISMFEKDRIFIAPDLNVNDLIEKGFTDEQILALIEKKGDNNKEFSASDFKTDFLENLKIDKEKISDLIKRWDKVDFDPKMDAFVKELNNKLFDKKYNQSGKLVIFTESTETAKEIEEKLKLNNFAKTLTIDSSNRKDSEAAIRRNFDANLEESEWEFDFDIIITTEVLAEGINLHRSNVIVNYDVPWNASRLMQRIGRVNRIGTKADDIFVFNFYPSVQGDNQINLHNKALRKLQSFHTAFGEDNKIFSLLEEVGDGALYGNKIQQEESEILKYLNELREFKKKNKAHFEDISKIPNKARVGRDENNLHFKPVYFNDNETIPENVTKSSVCFLKAENHPGVFCFVSEVGNTQVINFLDAVKLFKAKPDEKRIPFHNNHFDHANIAFKQFKSDSVQSNFHAVSKKELSPVENKAITNLNYAIKFSPTPQKTNAMRLLIDNIKNGTFASKGTPKKINDFFKVNEKLIIKEKETFYEKLFVEIIDDLNLNASEKNTKKEYQIINPKIVLTVSIN